MTDIEPIQILFLRMCKTKNVIEMATGVPFGGTFASILLSLMKRETGLPRKDKTLVNECLESMTQFDDTIQCFLDTSLFG